MKKEKLRKCSAWFKAIVAIELLKVEQTLGELVKKFEGHPKRITTRNREFLANAEADFGGAAKEEEPSVPTDQLYQQIGQLNVENGFLKKLAQSRPLRERLQLTDKDYDIRVCQQSELLGINRSTLYFKP